MHRLDTAGRYVTQDSHQAVDSAAWEGFLDLLKKYRKRRPINGVLVAMSLSELLTQSEAERNAQVIAIRQRIQELYKHFGIRFPVYMMFTKCDLVAGFMEFFDDLDHDGRQQVWGTTFQLQEKQKDGDDDITAFRGQLDLLLERLTDRMTWRMSQERDQSRRSKIYTFPQQLIALSATLDSFLRDVFSSSRFDDTVLVRGVYFTSGIQEGAPIDRMMSVMAKTFGVAEQALPSFGGKGRSYFITDLLRNIVFQESGWPVSTRASKNAGGFYRQPLTAVRLCWRWLQHSRGLPVSRPTGATWKKSAKCWISTRSCRRRCRAAARRLTTCCQGWMH